MQDMEIYQALITVEKALEYPKWCKEIPYINFPQSWSIQVIPPFMGAVVRYRVRDARGHEVSVFLDCYDRLGCGNGKPYWEVYPASDGDIARFPMQDTEALIGEITKCFLKWDDEGVSECPANS